MNFENYNSFKFNLVTDLNKSNFEKMTPLFMHCPYSRVQWTNEDNEKIVNHVKRFGPKNWKYVAAEIQTKNAKKCRDHYNDVLDPQIRNTIWTREEGKTLLLKFEQFGPHWSKIKRFLPGRTTGMIKNYMKILLKKKRDLNEDNKKLFKNEVSNDIDEKNKSFLYYDIESLLNHHSKS